MNDRLCGDGGWTRSVQLDPKSEKTRTIVDLSEGLVDRSVLQPGTVVADRFRVEECIGEGAMGRVYRVWQDNLRRHVALKVLKGIGGASSRAQQRFLREARVASSVNHPNIVKIHDAGQDGSILYIAMELLLGRSLRDRLADGAIPLAETLALARQLLDALRAAHSLSLVHRDLKPGNIFVHEHDSRWHATVVDFGLAFIRDRGDVDRLTETGMLVGTPAFLAPEQAQAQAVGPPADIYSLGCVLYQMLTGRRVFLGSQMNVLAQHSFVLPVPPRARAPQLDIPETLDELVMQMLAKHPGDRPTAPQLISQLKDIVDARADPSPTTGRKGRMLCVPVPAPPVRIDAAALRRHRGGVARSLDVGAFENFAPDLWTAMSANGLVLHPMDRLESLLLKEYDAVLTRTIESDWIRSIIRLGVPVIVMAPSLEVKLCAQLIRIGVSEVVGLNAPFDRLARAIRRSVARDRRRRARG